MQRNIIFVSTIIFVFIFGMVKTSFGQQYSQYSMLMQNIYQFNKALPGVKEGVNANFVFRNQWAGIEGTPRQVGLSVFSEVPFLNGGIGISMNTDRIGVHEENILHFSYNYLLNTRNKSQKVSFGIDFAVNQYSVNGDQIITSDGFYKGEINHNDKVLFEDRLIGNIAPQFGVSAIYQKHNFKAGVSILDIMLEKIGFSEKNQSIFLEKWNHSTLFVEYEFGLGNNFSLKQFVFAKTDFKEYQYNLSTSIIYYEKYFLGAAIRGFDKKHVDAVPLFFGIALNDSFILNYNYDLSLNEIGRRGFGSHEVLIQWNMDYSLGKGNLPNIEFNPRL